MEPQTANKKKRAFLLKNFFDFRAFAVNYSSSYSCEYE
jgi:hypothetical protein